jgi:hypothetical protein
MVPPEVRLLFLLSSPLFSICRFGLARRFRVNAQSLSLNWRLHVPPAQLPYPKTVF